MQVRLKLECKGCACCFNFIYIYFFFILWTDTIYSMTQLYYDLNVKHMCASFFSISFFHFFFQYSFYFVSITLNAISLKEKFSHSFLGWHCCYCKNMQCSLTLSFASSFFLSFFFSIEKPIIIHYH